MTTLEIKRLDSVKTRSLNTKSQISNVNTDTETYTINITKSASYANQLNSPLSLKSLKTATDATNTTTTSGSTTATTTSPASRSSFHLNSSDQINDINTDTLRFNKYGFIQGNKTEDLYASPVKQDEKTSTLSKHNATTPLSTLNRSNHDYTEDISQIGNLKDYLQNSDVEEFAEQIPIKVIQQRELKWVEMLKNYDEWMDKRFKKIKSRCRKGIPQSMRSKAWMHLTGAVLLKKSKPNYYIECLTNPNKVDVARYIEDIKKDLHRQFPSHEIFMKREGRQMLFNVLKAYAVHNREVGYCQAQGPIAALLLMHMPEEDAFWILIRISDFYLKEYYKPGLEKVQIDGHALFYLFKKENSTAYKLMVSQGIDPILYMTEWFMCVYARTLPWCTVLRVWDMFFCEGVKVLYRVGLYLMLSAFNDKQKFQRCQQQGMYETLNLLKNLPIESLREEDLVRDSTLIKVNQVELKKAFDKCKVQFIKEKSETASRRQQHKT